MYRTHGESHTRLYRIWKHMKSRCSCPSVTGYDFYGGKGVSVCQDWCDSYEKFRDWALDNGYKDDLTLDRKDGNGDYCPENCRWITRSAQMRNIRSNVNITFNGETHILMDWSHLLGVPYELLRSRLRAGWSVERAFTENIGGGRNGTVA